MRWYFEAAASPRLTQCDAAGSQGGGSRTGLRRHQQCFRPPMPATPTHTRSHQAAPTHQQPRQQDTRCRQAASQSASTCAASLVAADTCIPSRH